MKSTNLLYVLAFFIFIFAIEHVASAQTNSTFHGSLPSMFNPANIQSNSYNDASHNFSILPPSGWVVQSQSNESGNAFVVFSNQNTASLANFAIYYNHGRPISTSVIALPDNIILDQAMAQLFNSSQTQILQKNIERFSDGFVFQVVLAAKQNTNNSPINEEFIFWLEDGRQYYLLLTSSQNGLNQNAADFERSVYTFYVGPEKVPATSQHIPAWIKNNAKWWSDGSIDDNTFVAGIQYMIKVGIIKVPPANSASNPSTQIPSWIKNDAGWWADGKISDDEFVRGIQYLIGSGIIMP